MHAIPILLLTIPGLLALIDGAPTRRRAAQRGWWFGFGLNLLGLYWLTEPLLIEVARFWWVVPFAAPMMASVMALFVAGPAAVARMFPSGWRRCVALAASWTLSDIGRQFIATGFPWNPWGSVWAISGGVGDIFLQPAAWVGVYGLGLATLLLAATPVLSWRWRFGGLALLVLWIVSGAARLAAPPPPSSGVTALLVQGNVAQGQKLNRDFAASILRRYVELTAKASAGASFVVWPETAVPFLIEQEPVVRERIAQAAGGGVSLVGGVRFGSDDRPRNSLFVLLADGTIADVYDKWHLVPFGEYQPDWLPLPIQVVPGGGFEKGVGPRTINLLRLPSFGPLICYEAIFGSQIVAGKDRPAWLVNVTNDAWFGNSSGPRQHLAAARMRAVEEGLPLLRAANTGISAAFDAYGREMGRLDLNIAGTLRVTLPGFIPPTLYARFGLLIPIFLSITFSCVACKWSRYTR